MPTRQFKHGTREYCKTQQVLQTILLYIIILPGMRQIQPLLIFWVLVLLYLKT